MFYGVEMRNIKLIVTNLDKLRVRKVMKLKLITYSNNLCTIGSLYNEIGGLICNTFELPWLSNQPNVSCIPAGTYTIKPTESARFGSTYIVDDVVGRSHILFHKGNTTNDTEGCILPCSTYGVLSGKWAGLDSKNAYNKLMGLLDNGEHQLTIKRY
jgi:hypothetical protein